MTPQTNPGPGPVTPNGAQPPYTPPSWAGLPVDELGPLVQHLCRIRNRRWLFGGSEEAIVERGSAAISGRVLFEALNYLRQRSNGFPTQQDLAQLVNVNPGTFGAFLRGEPSRNP